GELLTVPRAVSRTFPGESRGGFDALHGALPGPGGPAFPGDSCTAHAPIPGDAARAPALRLSVHRRPGDPRAVRGGPGSAEPPDPRRGDGPGVQARAPAGQGRAPEAQIRGNGST